MNTLTRMPSTPGSFVGRLILLVLVAGVLEPQPGGHHAVFPGVEVLFRTSTLRASAFVTTTFQEVERSCDFTVVYAGIDRRYGPIAPKRTIGWVTTRPPHAARLVTAFFNIPHQNIDEDEAFVYLPAVA